MVALMNRWRVLVVFALALAAGGAGPVEQLRGWLAEPRERRGSLDRQPFAVAPLSKPECEQAAGLLWQDHVALIRDTRRQEWEKQSIAVGGETLRFKSRHFGAKPKDGWNLYLSMHGGGNAPAAVNDQQWDNQIRLYQPKDSLYIAPRAPTNGWDLWHEPHVDALFDRLIEDAIVLGEVNPNRVYLMGYSAGGDGVYQLAPRMADRFAAASMMAGHPNDASPLGLRNLPFTIHVGALDNGYGRNKVAVEWQRKLDALQAADPDGYVHLVKLHPGRAHWMNLEDSVAVDWMARFTRQPLPTRVVWGQGHAPHNRFYWLEAPPDQAKFGQLVIASRKGQEIEIEKTRDVSGVGVLLNDAMVDLDQPVTVRGGGKVLFNGIVPRRIATLSATLDERGDPDLVFSASVPVRLP